MEDLNKYNLLADFYEFTMGNGYLENGYKDVIAYFDLYFRTIPDDGGYAIFAGLEQVVEYLKALSFNEEDIELLRSRGNFKEEFLDYLLNFKFECDVWSFEEGEVIFPNEPLITVRGPIIQVQLVETMLLVSINHQSLIATKSNRIVLAAKGRQVVEFGARRAQGYSASIYGARAAYISGCVGTSNTLAGKHFGIPALGTMAHSWVQFFDTELEAFRAYARSFPESCNLLIDTYDIMTEGLPNAIKVFKEEVVPRGFRPKGVRIDSGDIAYLSKRIRKVLDDEGFPDVQIMASNSLDEYIIESLLNQDAKIDSFGVGERLITAKSDPVFGCVYKLVATEENGEVVPKIKISENIEKITTPGFKQVYRFYDKETNAPMADLITLHEESYEDTETVEIFHPTYTWKRKVLENYRAVPMMKRIFDKGELVYRLPTIEEIRIRCSKAVSNLWEEQKRTEYPHKYIVDLSQKLWDIKNDLLNSH